MDLIPENSFSEEDYSFSHSEKIIKGQMKRISDGLPASRAFLGYKNVIKEGRKVVEIDKDSSEFIVTVFRLYSSGSYSLRKLALKLRSMKLGEKGKRFKTNPVSLQKIITNSAYCGLLKDCNGRIFKASFDAIVDLETFEKANKLLIREISKE
ncbi:MAG: recombinase family protein [Candidatus Coatesbacteria bacterium]|nr:recombinase family protein [Candidatus Coatesbacteria bacterium]